MVSYRKILYYYSKGNNNSQIATICCCSRMTVVKIVSRAKEIKLSVPIPNSIKDYQLKQILFPVTQEESKYLLLDFEWETFQMLKHQSGVRLCWRRYCKRALKAGKMAYTLGMYYKLYKEYKELVSCPMTEMELQWQKLKLAVQYYEDGNQMLYQKALKEKQEWLNKNHLDEEKL